MMNGSEWRIKGALEGTAHYVFKRPMGDYHLMRGVAVVLLGALLLNACMTSALISPVGHTKEITNQNIDECYREATRASRLGVPLDDQEKALLQGRSTVGFLKARLGSAPSALSDRYVVCLLKRDYQWIDMPAPLFPQSACQALRTYKKAGAEPDRVLYLCRTELGDAECQKCLEQ